MADRTPEYIICQDMIHIRDENTPGKALCGLSLEGVIHEPKRATHGFCLNCQEKHQMPGMGLALTL